MLHVQPVPLATVGSSPVGRTSVTVTVPLVAAAPIFATVRVKFAVEPRTNVDELDAAASVRFGKAGGGGVRPAGLFELSRQQNAATAAAPPAPPIIGIHFFDRPDPKFFCLMLTIPSSP